MLATLAGDSKSVIQIWDAITFEKINEFDLPYTKPRRTLQWSVDNSKVFSAGESNGQAVFFSINISDGTVHEIKTFPPSEAELFSIDSAEHLLAISSPDGIVQFIDIKTDNRLTRMKTVNQPVDIAWHPNSNLLAVLDYQTTLQLWLFIK